MNWFYSIIISTVFFILSQLALRQSFEMKSTPMHTFTLFTMTIGMLSLFVLSQQFINLETDVRYPILAGVLFFFGLMLWIYAISSKESLGSIRIVMAGFETTLLFLLSYLLFSDHVTKNQIIGSIIILLGILITNF